jgi:hypothetical protein
LQGSKPHTSSSAKQKAKVRAHPFTANFLAESGGTIQVAGVWVTCKVNSLEAVHSSLWHLPVSVSHMCVRRPTKRHLSNYI